MEKEIEKVKEQKKSLKKWEKERVGQKRRVI